MSRRVQRRGSPQIEQVRHDIEQWRRSRTHRCRMPEALWAAAVGVAREHGVGAASRALGVGYASLKARVTGKPPRAKGRPKSVALSPAGFVEVGSAMPFGLGAGGVSVELTRGDGAKVTVRLPAGAALDVVGLARELWSHRA